MWLGLGILTIVGILITHNIDLSGAIDRLVSQAENSYQKWEKSQPLTNPLFLIPFAALGGLLASISPCILALLPEDR